MYKPQTTITQENEFGRLGTINMKKLGLRYQE